MIKINKILKSIFISSIESQSYLIQLKANALMYFNLFFLTFMIILCMALAFVPVDNFNRGSEYIIIVLTMVTCSINLILLRRGKYYIAANTMSFVLVFLTSAGIRPVDVMGKSDYDFFPKELADKYRLDNKRVMQTRCTDDIRINTSPLCKHDNIWLKTNIVKGACHEYRFTDF